MITSFSDLVSKGISANLLKRSSKRRRTMAEIKADKEAKQKKEQEEAQKDAELLALQQQVLQLQAANNTGQLATDMMSQFVGAGLVEHTGQDEFVIHSSQGDKQFSASKKK